MTVIITDTTVYTGDGTRSVLYNAAVAVDGDVLLEVGPSADVEARHPDAEFINGKGKAVFPGLINCHTHLLAVTDRGMLEDFGFPTTLGFPQTGRIC